MKKIIVLLITASMIFTVSCSGSTKTAGNSNQAKTSASTATAVPANSSKSSAKEVTQSKPPAKSTGSSGNNVQTTKKSTSQSNTVIKKQNTVSKYFTLKITRDSGKSVILNKKIVISGNNSAMYYLRKNANVEDNGGFIEAINGLKTVSQANLSSDLKSQGIMGIDWFIYLNNKKTSCGINDVYPKNGDTLNLDYKAWTYKDLAQ